MTREQLDTIRARVEAAPKAGDTYIDEDGNEVRILEDGDMPALLAEVERLTGERDASHRDGMDRMQQAIIDLLQAHNAPAELIARIVEMEYP